MPRPFDPTLEAQLKATLDQMRAREDAANGPGAFDRMAAKGRLMMTKRREDLTPEEAAFLEAPPPARAQ